MGWHGQQEWIQASHWANGFPLSHIIIFNSAGHLILGKHYLMNIHQLSGPRGSAQNALTNDQRLWKNHDGRARSNVLSDITKNQLLGKATLGVPAATSKMTCSPSSPSLPWL